MCLSKVKSTGTYESVIPPNFTFTSTDEEESLSHYRRYANTAVLSSTFHRHMHRYGICVILVFMSLLCRHIDAYSMGRHAQVKYALTKGFDTRNMNAINSQLGALRTSSSNAEPIMYTEEYTYDDIDEDEEEDYDTEDIDGASRKRITDNNQEWMFFDVAKINVKGGEGGDGCMAMRREFRIEFGGPSGGNGGAGGSVYIECDESLNTLSMLRRRVHHRGKDGTNGRGDSRHGHKG